MGVTQLPDRIEVDDLGLVIRVWTSDDAPALHEAVVASTEHLRPWMPWILKEPLTVEDRRALIAQWHEQDAAGGDAVYGIWRDDVVVGGTGLHHRIGPGGLEIGYWVHVDHVRQGIASAASRALTDAAFTMDDIDRVEIHHDLANDISRRVPARLGFTYAGEEDASEGDRAPSETGRQAVWRVTRTDWRTLSA